MQMGRSFLRAVLIPFRFLRLLGKPVCRMGSDLARGSEKNLLERFTNGDASARMECAGFWRTEARLRDHSDGSFAYGDEPDHQCKWRRIP